MNILSYSSLIGIAYKIEQITKKPFGETHPDLAGLIWKTIDEHAEVYYLYAELCKIHDDLNDSFTLIQL